jgi:hypothetical protein
MLSHEVSEHLLNLRFFRVICFPRFFVSSRGAHIFIFYAFAGHGQGGAARALGRTAAAVRCELLLPHDAAGTPCSFSTSFATEIRPSLFLF